jgi:hypothetical protein
VKKRLVRVLAVAVLVVTMLVVVSAPAFARRAIGGQEVPTTVCSVVVNGGGSGLFEWREGGEVCWFTPPVVSGFSSST